MEHPAGITLEQVLSARDARAQRQRALLTQYPGCSLLCVLVNTPGPVKRLPESDRVFAAGVSALRTALSEAGIEAQSVEQISPVTGCEAYLAVSAAPECVKQLACRLEETLPYGRLLDFDVLCANGLSLSRTVLGFGPRNCIVCGKPGAGCASRRAHPLAEILPAFYRLAALAPEESL